MSRITRPILDARVHLRPSPGDVRCLVGHLILPCVQWTQDQSFGTDWASQGAGTARCEIGPRSFSVGPFSADFKAAGDVIASIGGHANRHRRDR